jgi:acyl-CoA thioesterase FadM
MGHERWRSRVRLAEVGAEGWPKPARVVEWMQEAAAAASTAVGFPRERFREMGAAWFIREVSLVLDAPLPHEAEVEVETWVYDLRRFRSERQYVIRCRGEVVGRGTAEWLFLELDAEGRPRPRRPSPEMLEAFPRTGRRLLIPAQRLPFPDAGGEAHEDDDRRWVRPSELDDNGHVNHTVYVGWCDDHAAQVLGPRSRLVGFRIRYEQDCRWGDELRLGLVRWPGGIWGHEIWRGDVRVARAVAHREEGPWPDC